MNAESANPKLQTLEIGRAIAALLVVLHHASQATDAFTSSNISHFLEFGMYGVDYFFVLSGFIIYFIHQDDPKTFRSAAVFASKRVRRIYVPYLPISFAMIAVYTLYPELSQSNRDWGMFTSVTLLPSSDPPALSLAWTLVFEMVFYIAFLLFFFTHHFRAIVVVWAVAIVALWKSDASVHQEIPFFKTMFDPMVLEFIAGGMAAAAFRWIRPSFGPLLVALGLAALGVCAFIELPHRFFCGLAIAPLVLGLALVEVKYKFEVPNAILLLGSASYAVYLAHNPIQSVIGRILQPIDVWWLTFGVCVIVGVGVGLLYHKVYEKPALRLIGKASVKQARVA